jgi:predicted lipoprotein with Yx(FWY)xxD motif
MKRTINKGGTMHHTLQLFALAALALVTAVFIGTSGATPQKALRLSVRQTSLGKILVDGRGRSVYLFERDKRGTSACYGACASYWPPVTTTGKPRAGAGVRASLLGVTKRRDGTRQVTYARHPLYEFSGDTKAGDTTGEGLTDFGAAWDVVAPNGKGIDR